MRNIQFKIKDYMNFTSFKLYAKPPISAILGFGVVLSRGVLRENSPNKRKVVLLSNACISYTDEKIPLKRRDFLIRGCGQIPGLIIQPDQGSVDTPKGSYFQVMF